MDEKDKKSKYNMSQLILMRINDSAIRASERYRAGDIEGWYFEWKNIKFQIVAKLKKDQRTKLKNLEKQISKTLRKKTKPVKKIEEYIELIQDYIEDKEMGLADAGDETVFT